MISKVGPPNPLGVHTVYVRIPGTIPWTQYCIPIDLSLSDLLLSLPRMSNDFELAWYEGKDFVVSLQRRAPSGTGFYEVEE